MRVKRRGDFMDIDIGGNIEHVLKVEEAVKLARRIIQLAPEVDLRITLTEAEERFDAGLRLLGI